MNSRLLKYVETHFQPEETLMRPMNYPDLDSHAEQHRFFERRVAELRQKNGEATTEDALIFLRDWFLRHILEEDRRFVPREIHRPAVDKYNVYAASPLSPQQAIAAHLGLHFTPISRILRRGRGQ